MSDSERDGAPPKDIDRDEADSPNTIDKRNYGDVDDSNVTDLSGSLLASLDSLDELADNATASMSDEIANTQFSEQDTHRQEQYVTDDNQLYTVLSQLRHDIDDIRQEQSYQHNPPAEQQMYDLVSVLRRDIEALKHEQGMPNVGGSDMQFYGALSELRRDIGELKQHPDHLAPANLGARVLTWMDITKLAIMGVTAGLVVVILQGGIDWMRTEVGMGMFTSSPKIVNLSSTPSVPPQTKIAGDIFGFAGMPINLDIDLSKLPVTPGSVVRISSLPNGAVLSSGQRKANGWLVPVSDLRELSMVVPAGFAGFINARVEVLSGTGKFIYSDYFKGAIMVNAVQRQAIKKNEQSPAAEPVIIGQPIQAPVPKLASEEEKELIANANSLLNRGDVVGARRVFDFAVSQGSVSAAVALARTYDPKIVNQMTSLSGVEPDITRAKVLYYFAARKGNKEAAKRLSEIREEEK